jgi:competence protein CoiA
MLVALNANNNRRPAFEADKNENPFTCPFCMQNVVLKKGKVREHHYAHEPNSDCKYGEGESQLHYRVKKEIYLSLKDHPNCQKCEVERVLKGVRPDISLVINSYYVAIEVQKNKISIDEINKRFDSYSKLGIFLLWVLPDKGPKLFFHEGEKEEICRINNWENHIQDVQNNRIYYWQSGAFVKPYHLGSFYIYKEEKEWYGEYGELRTSGGVWEEKKSYKMPIQYPIHNLHIANDFMPEIRKCTRREKNKFPDNSKIWIDKKEDWWKEYYDKLHKRIMNFHLMA